MTKGIYTLLRYLLTAAGASEAVASDALLMQVASGIVAAASVLWGLYESRHHAQLEKAAGSEKVDGGGAGLVPLLLVGTCLLPVLLVCQGCTTTTALSADGSTETTRSVDWAAVDVLVKGSAQTATVLILSNNDDLTDAFTALNSGVAAVFVGTPTQESLEAAIAALDTGLESGDITAVAGVLMTAYAYYAERSGETVLVASNTVVKGLVTAFTEGVSAGIALHKTDVSATEGE